MEDSQDYIGKATQLEVINQIIQKLREYYIFPVVVEQICTHLHKTMEDGEYNDLEDGNLFALGLTIQLQEVSHDEHLWVRWHAEPLPAGEEALRLNPTWQKQERDKAQLENFGINKMEILAGNVGYVDIHYLHRPAWAGEKIAQAMQFIAPTGAAILDLRKCSGGYPHMIALLCSFLFVEEPIHLISIYWRDEDFTQQYWTLPYIPGQRFPNKPLYVLTSRDTFSGGEIFAGIMQSRKRATLIGEKTDGGAHVGASFYLHPHFEACIPIGRTINPLNGIDWEGNGITPDILLPSEQSFNAAYRLALQALLAGSKPTSYQDRSLEDEIQAALKSVV